MHFALRRQPTLAMTNRLLRYCSTVSEGGNPTTQATCSSSSRPTSNTFKSSISFKVSDSKVTPETLPSVEELEKLIPSLDDLRRQIPSAKEMETKYVFKKSTEEQKKAADAATASGENKPLWPNCDTPEEIMDEERYGADGEVRPAPTSEQVKLAWRALAWGTLYATIGVSVASYAVLWFCGFHSWSSLVEHLRTREDRERERLRAAAEQQAVKDGNDAEGITHFVLDLTNPMDLPRQVEEIYAAIQAMAEEASAKEAQLKNAPLVGMTFPDAVK